MAFQYLTNVPVEQAGQEYLALLIQNGMAPRSERIPTVQAAGRVTAEAVYAHICAPHYAACAMDGIAVSAAVTYGATETTPVHLRKDQYVVVDTGDPLPDGCDAVIMVEEVVHEEDGVRLHDAAAPWQHIRQIGEDICAGDMILAAHSVISPSAVGALLAGGVMEVSVIRQPVVGIIPTGDEIIAPVADPKPGDIIEFNSSIFSGMLAQWGAIPRTYPIVKDQKEALTAVLQDALDSCDMVVINAGTSAGREDYTSAIIREKGGILYHGIAIKPGKPAILGYCGPKPVLGVPGYPVSGIVVLEQILKPIVAYCAGFIFDAPQEVEAVLSRRVVSGLKYKELVRVRMGYVGERLIASPLARGAGVISSFMKADGIMEVPQGTEGVEAGETVRVRLLRPLEELRSTLVAIGSHDPLLDELANLMHLHDGRVYMSSSHVGSMGGIMAVRRGEAHLAGCHLLDEQDGSYNESFLKKYFPQGGVRLVECVGRKQGFMLEKGNPKGIRTMADLTKQGVRYVNRQKGSGTRILFDYLCKKEAVVADAIYGFEREEFTHTAVAAQIAAGTADCGLGIYSAAKMYDLDFLPLCDEQYDLLIPEWAWETELVQQLIATLQSAEFRQRLESLGGYTVDQPGRVRFQF